MPASWCLSCYCCCRLVPELLLLLPAGTELLLLLLLQVVVKVAASLGGCQPELAALLSAVMQMAQQGRVQQ